MQWALNESIIKPSLISSQQSNHPKDDPHNLGRHCESVSMLSGAGDPSVTSGRSIWWGRFMSATLPRLGGGWSDCCDCDWAVLALRDLSVSMASSSSSWRGAGVEMATSI